eukprot:GILK01006225.1.p1 GENE.GILK01006225.1~~GILK01006225.1.p1  ORF type:complete len:313 (-),score=42.80 GILK01006225.1:133-1071(-)
MDDTKNDTSFLSKLIFLGTGSSLGTPAVQCVMEQTGCKTCTSAHMDPTSKNNRGNPSLLIHYVKEDGAVANIVIDVGKTFRQCALRSFGQHSISSLDAVILTHDHADAMLGLDDLRGIQTTHSLNNGGTAKKPLEAIPIYLSQSTFQAVSRVFPYLVQTPDTGVFRWVASLSWHIIERAMPFVIKGLEFTPLPVFHGEDYICLGFMFGRERNVVYLSDVSRVPVETEELIAVRGRIDILVLDALNKDGHETHFSLSQALDCIRRWKPVKSYLIGMSHSIEHSADSLLLANMKQSEGLDVELSFDSLAVPVNL